MIHRTDFGLGHLDNFLRPSSNAKPYNCWSYSRKFHPMTSAPNDSFLSLDQDTNWFSV